MGNPHSIFLNALGGFGNASAPAAVASLFGAIIPEKVLQHYRKAQGRFGGTGTVPSDYK